MFKLILIVLISFAIICSAFPTGNHINHGNGNHHQRKSLKSFLELYKEFTGKRCGNYYLYEMCSACAEATENERVFQMCCLDLNDARKWCNEYIEYSLE